MSLFVATPMCWGLCTEPFHSACISLTELLSLKGIEHAFFTTRNESLVTRARNECVRVFIESGFDQMMFIDSDIDFIPNDVRRLYDFQEGVRGGLYRLKARGAGYSGWKDGRQIVALEPGPPEPVDYMGTGFLMVSRETIVKMMEAYGDLWLEDGSYALFDTSIEQAVYMPEDYTFCKRWRDLGGTVWADPSIRLKHWGWVAFE